MYKFGYFSTIYTYRVAFKSRKDLIGKCVKPLQLRIITLTKSLAKMDEKKTL